MINYLLIVFGAALILSITGCGSTDSDIVAKVNGDAISVKDLDEIFERGRYNFNSFEEEFETRLDILDSLVIQQLLVQEAYQRNIDDLEEINRIVLANRDQFLLDLLYQRQILDKIDVTEQDVRDHYDKLEYKVQASHILVEDEETANAILDSLNNGANFQKMAVEHSTDPSVSTNQGDLGYFTWGQMEPAFQEEVFKLEPGQISEPFKTRFGWHIAKVIDRVPNDLRGSFDKEKDKIRDALESRLRGQRLQEYRTELQDKYQVKVDTITCEYLLHKRETLYPPGLLETMPRNDFDIAQLDRHERELVLASWDGGQITLGQYLGMIRSKNVDSRLLPDFDNYEGLKNIIFQLKFEDILASEARALGLENDKEFKRKIRRFKEIAMADIMENDSIQYPGEPDEGEMRQYYEEHQDEFMIPEKVHLYEIMFNDYNMAKTYVNKVGTLTKFKSIAAKHTVRSGKKAVSGDMGWVEERFYPRLFRAVENIEVGEVGGPVQVGGKWSIIFVADRKPSTVKDFLMVKPQIYDTLEKQKRRDAFEQWVVEKREDANIRIYENAVRAGINKAKYEES